MIEAIIDIVEESLKSGKYIRFEGSFKKLSNVYYFTNENIKGYFDALDFSDCQRVLTVCASGDHIFDLVYKGVKQIDTFDINELSEYFALGIKKAAILSFSYSQFLQFMEIMANPTTPFEQQYDLFLRIQDQIEEKYKPFWQELFKRVSELSMGSNTISLLRLLCMNYTINTVSNDYLHDEQSYNQTKQNLKTTKISFKACDVLELSEHFQGEYDKIFLSNIIDYLYRTYGNFWDFNQFKKVVKEKYDGMLSGNGELIFAYIFRNYSYQSQRACSKPIHLSNTSLDDLRQYRSVIIPYVSSHAEQYELSSTVGDMIYISDKIK